MTQLGGLITSVVLLSLLVPSFEGYSVPVLFTLCYSPYVSLWVHSFFAIAFFLHFALNYLQLVEILLPSFTLKLYADILVSSLWRLFCMVIPVKARTVSITASNVPSSGDVIPLSILFVIISCALAGSPKIVFIISSLAFTFECH